MIWAVCTIEFIEISPPNPEKETHTHILSIYNYLQFISKNNLFQLWYQSQYITRNLLGHYE